MNRGWNHGSIRLRRGYRLPQICESTACMDPKIISRTKHVRIDTGLVSRLKEVIGITVWNL